jgi:DNA-directed RNA polymerase specialized sigma24 family protein
MNSDQTGAWFHTTSWGLVISARANAGDLELLLRAYWSPVYAFIRKKGYGTHDASDLTQEFLSEVLVARDLIGKADPSRGRFRSFLKSALRNFLIDQHRNAHSRRAAPRDGVASINASPTPADESLAVDEPTGAFDRQWAAAVLALTIERTEGACRQEGLDAQWTAFSMHVLRPLLGKTRGVALEEIARKVGATGPAQVSNMVQTIKRRFRKMLRQVVAETVSRESDVDDELASLKRFFENPG